MSPTELEASAESYTFASILSSLATIISGAALAEAPQHLGWLVATSGFAFLTIVASRRRSKLLQDAERARAIGETDL